MVTLTVRVDTPAPHPPYGQLFVIFLGVRLAFEYDYMCSETNFTQEKSHFYPTTKITILPFACCCSVTKWSDSSIAEELRI